MSLATAVRAKNTKNVTAREFSLIEKDKGESSDDFRLF